MGPRSQASTPDELLGDFATQHGLVPAGVEEVDELLPRSCQVVDAHQLHNRWSDYGWCWYAMRGPLPGGPAAGAEAVVAHVRIFDRRNREDVFDLVRLPAPAGALVDTLDIRGRVGGELGAYGGHRMSEVPFPPGRARRVELAGVPSPVTVRVARDADDDALVRVLSPGFVAWLARAQPWCMELFDGWMSVFRIGHREEADELLYPSLCDAASRFVAACCGASPPA